MHFLIHVKGIWQSRTPSSGQLTTLRIILEHTRVMSAQLLPAEAVCMYPCCRPRQAPRGRCSRWSIRRCSGSACCSWETSAEAPHNQSPAVKCRHGRGFSPGAVLRQPEGRQGGLPAGRRRSKKPVFEKTSLRPGKRRFRRCQPLRFASPY